MAGVPEEYIVVRGGQSPLPGPSTVLSGSCGKTLEEAAGGVPHGMIRATTARAILISGGSVEPAPEAAYPGGPLNERHVNVREGAATTFSEPFPNPVPKAQRIPGRPPL